MSFILSHFVVLKLVNKCVRICTYIYVTTNFQLKTSSNTKWKFYNHTYNAVGTEAA